MMKSFCGLLIVFVLLNDSKSESLVRRKRFFNTLWPIEEVKSDVRNGLIYAQLPPEYMYLLPGVNEHKTAQRRSGVQQQPTPVRFVHPTRMAILMPAHQQKNPSTVLQLKAPQSANLKPQTADIQSNQQQVPRIVMKPVAQNPKLTPSITLKTKEQSLPDLHKNQRFVAIKPFPSAGQKLASPFNTQQQLPIKKIFDASPAVISSAPLLSVKTASVADFYYTREFNDLLNEFNIKVELNKLPPINDVMAILGTENNEETLKAIRDVTQSAEGMELIKGYLDQNQNEGDEFYNYDDDVGAGEIQVEGSDVKFVQSLQPQQSYGAPHQTYGVPDPSTPVNPSPSRPTTTGTLTGSGDGKSWWKPTSWFSSSSSTKLDSLQKDVEILKNVVPSSGSVWQNVNYVGNFLKPAVRTSVPIQQIPNVQSFPRRVFLQQPLKFSHSFINEDTKVLPSVRMTEEQFQDMVKTLRLTPMNTQHTQLPQYEVATIPEQFKKDAIPEQQEAEVPAADLSSLITAPLSKFEAPIVVQSVSTGISQQTVPLPSTFTQFDAQYKTAQALRTPQSSLELPNESSNQENRRNFISVSEPQRASPYDFIASGRVHQANPDEVFKRSRSLVEAIEGKQFNWHDFRTIIIISLSEEKSVVASISDLTEKHQNYRGSY